MNKAFIEISEGLQDAKAHVQGKESGVIEHVPDTLNVKEIREKTGMSQQAFCATFCVYRSAVRISQKNLW